jgi:hypothetical protein
MRNDKEHCKTLALQALEKDPTSVQAYSMLVRASSDDEQFERIAAQVPEIYRNTPDVSMALGEIAKQRGLLTEAEFWFRIAIQTDTRDHPDPRGVLADLLLTRLMTNVPTPQVSGIANPQAALVNEIVQLYDFAWARVARTDIRPFRLGWLVNRSTAKVWLGDLVT